jgi:hypothetical protein
VAEPQKPDPYEQFAKAHSHDGFDWAAHAEAVAADIFGACNEQMSRPPEDVRFGNKGSVSVNYITGQWYDFENQRGGGVKELICVYKDTDNRNEAIAYARQCLNSVISLALTAMRASKNTEPTRSAIRMGSSAS